MQTSTSNTEEIVSCCAASQMAFQSSKLITAAKAAMPSPSLRKNIFLRSNIMRRWIQS